MQSGSLIGAFAGIVDLGHDTGNAGTFPPLAGHFAYGAACGGSFYGDKPPQEPTCPSRHGLGTGCLAGSYLGWISLAGILRLASMHPGRRNALMIAVHLVWGGRLGLAAKSLRDSMQQFRKDELQFLPDKSDEHRPGA